MMEFLTQKTTDDIAETGENTSYKYFLLCSTCLRRYFPSRSLKERTELTLRKKTLENIVGKGDTVDMAFFFLDKSNLLGNIYVAV